MHFVYNLSFLIAAIKWGDWKNWRIYYPTILFYISGDLLKNFLLYDYPMWRYQETLFGESILFGHPIINLMIMAIIYPSTTLIFLGHYPRRWWKQALWIALWVFVYTTIEYVNLRYLNLINHYNGWNIGWSLVFNAVMFPILRIHHQKPLLAVAISIIFLIFLWTVFNVPIQILKFT